MNFTEFSEFGKCRNGIVTGGITHSATNIASFLLTRNAFPLVRYLLPHNRVEFKLTYRPDARQMLMTSRPLELHLCFHSFSILLLMYQLIFGNQYIYQ